MAGHTYFSFDVETAGPEPETHSMLSLGACVVDRPEEQFYAELKPVLLAYEPEAIRIGSLGLAANVGNPGSDPATFVPARVLENLALRGDDVIDAMTRFRDWAVRISGTTRPRMLTDTLFFDWRYLDRYLRVYAGLENPFGHEPISMKDVYRGATGDLRSSLRDLRKKVPARKTFGIRHNALVDARYNAAIYRLVLEMIRPKSSA